MPVNPILPKCSHEVVLHLSDLHFGHAGDANRKIALNALRQTLQQVDNDWLPTLVCISGDLGWKALRDDYGLAKQWVVELLELLKLTPEDLVLCPGNHDIVRGFATLEAHVVEHSGLA